MVSGPSHIFSGGFMPTHNAVGSEEGLGLNSLQIGRQGQVPWGVSTKHKQAGNGNCSGGAASRLARAIALEELQVGWQGQLPWRNCK